MAIAKTYQENCGQLQHKELQHCLVYRAAAAQRKHCSSTAEDSCSTAAAQLRTAVAQLRTAVAQLRTAVAQLRTAVAQLGRELLHTRC
jgi:hypothetical protein